MKTHAIDNPRYFGKFRENFVFMWRFKLITNSDLNFDQ
jgi:hypothetical protein